MNDIYMIGSFLRHCKKHGGACSVILSDILVLIVCRICSLKFMCIIYVFVDIFWNESEHIVKISMIRGFCSVNPDTRLQHQWKMVHCINAMCSKTHKNIFFMDLNNFVFLHIKQTINTTQCSAFCLHVNSFLWYWSNAD